MLEQSVLNCQNKVYVISLEKIADATYSVGVTIIIILFLFSLNHVQSTLSSIFFFDASHTNCDLKHDLSNNWRRDVDFM